MQFNKSKIRHCLAIVVLICFLLIAAFTSIGLRRAISVKDNATLYLLWEPQAQFAGYYVAESLGFFRDEGIEIKIRHDLGIGESLQQVKSDPNAFVVTQFINYLNFLQQEPDVALLSIINKGCSLGWVSNSDKESLNTTEALKNQNLYSWWGPNDLLLRTFLKEKGVDTTNLKNRLSTKYPLPLPDKMLALAMSYNEATELGNFVEKKHSFTSYCELGQPVFEDVLVGAVLNGNNNQLRDRMVRAVWRGWDWSLANPTGAVDVVMQYNPKRGRHAQESMLKLFLNFLSKQEDQPDGYLKEIETIHKVAKHFSSSTQPLVAKLILDIQKSTNLREIEYKGQLR